MSGDDCSYAARRVPTFVPFMPLSPLSFPTALKKAAARHPEGWRFQSEAGKESRAKPFSSLYLRNLDISLGEAFLDELRHVGDAEFAHDALAMELYGVLRHEEAFGNIL